MRFLDPDWCDLPWTPFIPFDAERQEFRVIPQLPGLYRVRVTGSNVLAYIGQTGRDLRERLSMLRRHTLAIECPWNDPHTAAPKLWSFRQAEGLVYECSAATVDSNDDQRQATECLLLWQYRLACGRSTLCNFGRLHPNYTTSGNRSTQLRGGRLPEGQLNPADGPSVPPLRSHAEPPANDWMGLEWSSLLPLSNKKLRTVPAGNGVYKILAADGNMLLYIGQSNNLRARLRTHSASKWGGRATIFSYSSLSSLTCLCQRLEVENDLIASHYATTGAAPIFQFGYGGENENPAEPGETIG